MKHLYLIAICAMIFGISVTSGNAADNPVNQNVFFITLYDIPGHPDLNELVDTSLVFDKPEGRIGKMTALIETNIDQTALLSFYKTALKQLGWSQNGPNTFSRNSETLVIQFSNADNLRFIHFALQPN